MTFYNRCTTDVIPLTCPPLPPPSAPVSVPTAPIAPPTSVPSSPPTAPTAPTSAPVSSPVSPPLAPVSPPVSPPGGCTAATKPGFSCIGGKWYHAGSYNGTADAVFEDDVIIGSNPSTDIATFQQGTYQFFGTLTVHGSLVTHTAANLSFHNLPWSAKRTLAVPRITADECAQIQGGIDIQLSTADIEFADGKLVALYATSCSVGTLPNVRFIVPSGECRVVAGSTTVSSGPPYTVRSTTLVDSEPCVNKVQPPSATTKKASRWWIGLLVALIVIAVLIIALVLVVIFVPPVRARVYPLFAKNKSARSRVPNEEGASSAAPMAAASVQASSRTGAVELDDDMSSSVENNSDSVGDTDDDESSGELEESSSQ